MIQQQTRIDIADNTATKTAMCIKVLGGSTARGKFKRKVAGVGMTDRGRGEDRFAERGCETARGGQGRDRPTQQPIRRTDGSYVRFDRNAAVIIDAEGSLRYVPYFRRCGPRTSRKELHEDRFLASEVV